MSVKQNLTDIAGSERVLDNPDMLSLYARDQSFAPRCRPDYVFFAESVAEVQQIIRLANKHCMPVTPFSSGLNFHGAALASHGGIVLNLSRMNKILEINEKNWFVVIEPGVTYEDLQTELMKKGYRIMVPFGVAPGRSVLTSYLERDPVMAAASFELGNFMILDTEIVLPDGEIFKTGLWASGGEAGGALGPIRNHIFRLWTGAQGTLGVMTKMGIHITPLLSQEPKVFFAAFNTLTEVVKPLRKIQRRQLGTECFLLNRFNLASLFSSDWKVPDRFPARLQPSESFNKLRKVLPPWMMVLCINGSPRLADEKIAFEVKALHEVARDANFDLREEIDGVAGSERILRQTMLQPWPAIKKFNYRGSVHALLFKMPLESMPDIESRVYDVCRRFGYAVEDLGAYLLPMERGRAVHCEFDLHCDLNNAEETGRIKRLWLAASEHLMDAGAYFDRPYGAWAQMVFSRSGAHTTKLREIKRELDPRGILNPGKLCF